MSLVEILALALAFAGTAAGLVGFLGWRARMRSRLPRKVAAGRRKEMM